MLGSSASKAAKRRKNVAHGVSRGYKRKTMKPRRGESLFLVHTLAVPFTSLLRLIDDGIHIRLVVGDGLQAVRKKSFLMSGFSR
jgi:hypothetical protein